MNTLKWFILLLIPYPLLGAETLTVIAPDGPTLTLEGYTIQTVTPENFNPETPGKILTIGDSASARIRTPELRARSFAIGTSGLMPPLSGIDSRPQDLLYTLLAQASGHPQPQTGIINYHSHWRTDLPSWDTCNLEDQSWNLENWPHDPKNCFPRYNWTIPEAPKEYLEGNQIYNKHMVYYPDKPYTEPQVLRWRQKLDTLLVNNIDILIVYHSPADTGQPNPETLIPAGSNHLLIGAIRTEEKPLAHLVVTPNLTKIDLLSGLAQLPSSKPVRIQPKYQVWVNPTFVRDPRYKRIQDQIP